MHGSAGRQNQNWNKNWQGPGVSACWEEKFDSLKSLNRWRVPVFVIYIHYILLIIIVCLFLHEIYSCFQTFFHTHTHTCLKWLYLVFIVVITFPWYWRHFRFCLLRTVIMFIIQKLWNYGHMGLEYHTWTAFRIEVASFIIKVWQWFDMFMLCHGGKSGIRTWNVSLAKSWHVFQAKENRGTIKPQAGSVADWKYEFMASGIKNNTALIHIGWLRIESSMMYYAMYRLYRYSYD